MDTKNLLKEYTWRVDPHWGLVFSPLQKAKGEIRLGPSIAKSVNRQISEMSNAEFQVFIGDFSNKDRDRLRLLRKIVLEMKEKDSNGLIFILRIVLRIPCFQYFNVM